MIVVIEVLYRPGDGGDWRAADETRGRIKCRMLPRSAHWTPLLKRQDALANSSELVP